MRLLGISAFYHDSAAALLVDGQLVAAAQEERFTRKRHDAGFPVEAIKYCLREGGIDLSQVDHVVYYEKPFLKFERLLETYLAFAPRGLKSFSASLPVWLKEKLFQRSLMTKELKALGAPDSKLPPILFSEHHLSHAASAYYPSPFDEAAVLTMDGVGEWTTTSLAVGKGAELKIHKEIRFPHSLGLLYSAFTYYTGFKVNSGEYKVMGLAPYGQPKYVQKIFDHLLDVKEDGTFRLNMEYFDYCTGLTMTNAKFAELFGAPARKSEERLTQREMDLAASVQAALEEVVLRLGRGVAKETGMRNLCLAGGVALNCVANGKLLRAGIFDQIWIQPAAGDAGGAVGAAYAAHYLQLGASRPLQGSQKPALDRMSGSYLGPSYTDQEIVQELDRLGAVYERLPDERALTERCADLLAEGKAMGWFQGRMEFGPRALGARSIIADPRSDKMQSTLNLKVKFRESFRPFAPAVLAEKSSEWFDLDRESPYMLLVADLRREHRRKMTEAEEALFGIDKLNVRRSSIPAVTHVDYSARVQTVHQETNPVFHSLLKRFDAKTGCPVLVNTSFNVRGEPIVCTPEDAFRCFMGTEIDVLALGTIVLLKEKQDQALRQDYKAKFELD